MKREHFRLHKISSVYETHFESTCPMSNDSSYFSVAVPKCTCTMVYCTMCVCVCVRACVR